MKNNISRQELANKLDALYRTGNYTHSCGTLCHKPEESVDSDNSCLCILGFVCEAFRLDHKKEDIEWRIKRKIQGATVYEFKLGDFYGSDKILPNEVKEWAGIDRELENRLIYLNDTKQTSFHDLLEIIRDEDEPETN